MLRKHCPPCSVVGAVSPQQRCSHGAPVTESPDLRFSMVLRCHGSCFTNYPWGCEPTLCPHSLYVVCIVRGIIFQLLPQTMNSCRDDSHLTNLRTPRKYKLGGSCYQTGMAKCVCPVVTLEHLFTSLSF